jgi:hypothetical protein
VEVTRIMPAHDVFLRLQDDPGRCAVVTIDGLAYYAMAWNGYFHGMYHGYCDPKDGHMYDPKRTDEIDARAWYNMSAAVILGRLHHKNVRIAWVPMLRGVAPAFGLGEAMRRVTADAARG